jgi:glycosyltransferase involved in cell wall biosynthesis
VRIGLVTNFRGGLKEFATSLCKGLRTKGFEVDVLCPAQLGLSSRRRSADHLPVHYGLPALARVFSGRYDLIHCNIASLSLAPILEKKLTDIPVVETFHGFPQWWLEPTIIDKASYIAELGSIQALARHASARTSVSNFVRSALLEVLGVESSVIHNGIAHCPVSLSTREQSRKEYKVEDGTVAILYVGRLHPAKDPITLLRAFDILVKQGKKVKLLVVGAGPLSKSFDQEIRERRLQGVVTNWNHLPSLHGVFSAADIFCLPSVNEAFGIVLLEAMDHFLPLLVSDSGAGVEIAGSGGISFRTGDAIDLSTKLAQLVDDSALRQKLGQEGNRRLQKHFGLDSMIESYVRVYEALRSPLHR